MTVCSRLFMTPLLLISQSQKPAQIPIKRDEEMVMCPFGEIDLVVKGNKALNTDIFSSLCSILLDIHSLRIFPKMKEPSRILTV